MRKQAIKPIDVLKVFNKMFLNPLDNPIFNYISENKNSLPKECKKCHFSIHDTGLVYFNFITEKFRHYEFEIYIPEDTTLKTEEKFSYKNVFNLLKPIFFHKSVDIKIFYSTKDEDEIDYLDKETESCSYYIEITDEIASDSEKIKLYKTLCTLVLLSKYEVQQIAGLVDYTNLPPPNSNMGK